MIAAAAISCLLALQPYRVPPSTADLRTQAEAAFRNGDLPTAERYARTLVELQHGDADNLTFLAAVLDAEAKFPEADSVYKSASALGPPSLPFLRNLAHHYFLTNRPEQGRQTLILVLDHTPADTATRMELARLAVEEKKGAAALRYLRPLPPNVAGQLDLLLIRAEALMQVNQRAKALEILRPLETRFKADPESATRLGLLLARTGNFADAESVFAGVVLQWPTDFSSLYNLGLAAAKARHYDRASAAFEAALRQRPEDPDLLLNLANVRIALRTFRGAAELLANAAKISPNRADVQLALAHAFEQTGFLGDAVTAWDRYITLQPDDDIARRNRAVALASDGLVDKAVKELTWYADRHPEDATGHYYLALILQGGDAANRELGKALRLKPDFIEANLLQSQWLLNAGESRRALAILQNAAGSP